MKIHEYQGKELLRQFGIPVPRGIPAFTVQEAVEAAQKLGGPVDRKSTRLNSSHLDLSRMPSSA